MKKILTQVFLSLCLYSFSQSNGEFERSSERMETNLRNKLKDAGKNGWDSNKASKPIDNGTNRFNYVYKNGKPYGTDVTVIYDGFYRNYTISFTKQNGETSGCLIKANNFIEKWKFKYNGFVYELK